MLNSVFICMYIVAEVVEWAPIGDHYALSSGTSVLHYDVQVKRSVYVYTPVLYSVCVVLFRAS